MKLLKIASGNTGTEYVNADKIAGIRFKKEKGNVTMLYIELINGHIYRWLFTEGDRHNFQDAVVEVFSNIEAYGNIINFERMIEHEGGKRC